MKPSSSQKSKEMPLVRLQGPLNKKLYMIKDTEFSNESTQSKEFANAIKPEDQLVLTDKELEEEIVRVLTAKNPHAPHNIIRYNYREGIFKAIPHVDQTYIHLDIVGSLIFKGTEEANLYEAFQKKNEQLRKLFYTKDLIDEYVDENGTKKFRILRNKFNFSDRNAQTFNQITRDASTMTEPPVKLSYSDQASTYILYQAYTEDIQREQQRLRDRKPVNRVLLERIQTARRKRAPPKTEAQKHQAEESYRMLLSVKLIERMISQNAYEEIMNDFRYYDDESDNFKKEGTLLPLWKFSNKYSKKMCVTCLCWNPKYSDLFAVSTGSYDFFKKSKGYIILFSLKNPSFFEVKLETESGCMAIDFNSKYPYLLAAGFYDGSVKVYDIRTGSKKDPKYECNEFHARHKDPVWQVKWLKDDYDEYMNFCSVSSDGRVTNWVIKNAELFPTDLAYLKLIDHVAHNKEESKDLTSISELTANGTCFDFNSFQDDLFLVGTEEGKVYEYSTFHKSQLLTSFDAHYMSIYAVKWNPFSKRIFITCSSDWTVKIWDNRYKDPIFTYDLGSVVSDVTWAPYSSTTFAAVTIDGNIHFYDLGVDKYVPLCVQNISGKKKSKLTRIAFNPLNYILIVSDDRGTVGSFKMSPNLRSIPKDSKNNPISVLNKKGYELVKLTKIIESEIDSSREYIKTERFAFVAKSDQLINILEEELKDLEKKEKAKEQFEQDKKKIQRKAAKMSAKIDFNQMMK